VERRKREGYGEKRSGEGRIRTERGIEIKVKRSTGGQTSGEGEPREKKGGWEEVETGGREGYEGRKKRRGKDE